MNIVSNCPLCEAHSLHVMNQETEQCLNCGYATSDRFVLNGVKEDNEMYKTLPEEMQSWSVEDNGRVWIPSMITLPFGTLYPFGVDNKMKWAFAKMIEISEEEQKNYPDENGGYFKQRYDTDNQKVFDTFIEAMDLMSTIAEKAKTLEEETKENVSQHKLQLPKLKKIDG